MPSYVVILVDKRDISNTAAIVSDKFTVTGRSLVARVGRQHALDTHADAFVKSARGPSPNELRRSRRYDAVAVDVWMHRDRSGCITRGGQLNELDFRRFYDC
jgi:hypothetical protein